MEKKWGSEHCWRSQRSLSSLDTMVWYVWWNRHSRSRPTMLPIEQAQRVARGITKSRIIAGPERVPHGFYIARSTCYKAGTLPETALEMLASLIFMRTTEEALCRLIGLCLTAEAMWAFRLYNLGQLL